MSLNFYPALLVCGLCVLFGVWTVGMIVLGEWLRHRQNARQPPTPRGFEELLKMFGQRSARGRHDQSETNKPTGPSVTAPRGATAKPGKKRARL